MRKFYIFILITLFLQISCQENFDEWEDTSQRYVTFTFDSNNYFSNILSYTNGRFQLGSHSASDSIYLLRTVCYCYDKDGYLLDMQTALSSLLEESAITIRHLFKDKAYYCVFMADVVKKDPYMNYYETWYQLGSKQYDNFYLLTTDLKTEPEHNILLSAAFHVLPANQIVPVILSPITYNGYCVFTNLGNVEKIDGWVGYNTSFHLKEMTMRERGTYEYLHYIAYDTDSIIIPLSLSNTDDEITVRVQTVTSNITNSAEHILYNKEHRPFVARFNASTLELDTCIFY